MVPYFYINRTNRVFLDLTMLRRRYRRSRGWAVLESSMALLVILTLVSVGFGLVQYLSATSFVERAVDQVIYDTAVKPFSLKTEAGRIELVLDDARLRQSVDEFSQQMSQEFDKYLQERELVESSPFSVEAIFAEIKIDPQSGGANGLAVAPFSYRSLRGDPALFSLNGKQDDFERDLLARIARGGSSSGSTEFVPSILAAPTAGFLFDAESSQHRFLPRTVMVGGRAALSLEDSYIGMLLGVIGVKPAVYYHKFVPLRGEIAK